jgi:hypothetical protein
MSLGSLGALASFLLSMIYIVTENRWIAYGLSIFLVIDFLTIPFTFLFAKTKYQRRYLDFALGYIAGLIVTGFGILMFNNPPG